jgi:hypothetical protein
MLMIVCLNLQLFAVTNALAKCCTLHELLAERRGMAIVQLTVRVCEHQDFDFVNVRRCCKKLLSDLRLPDAALEQALAGLRTDYPLGVRAVLSDPAFARIVSKPGMPAAGLETPAAQSAGEAEEDEDHAEDEGASTGDDEEDGEEEDDTGDSEDEDEDDDDDMSDAEEEDDDEELGGADDDDDEDDDDWADAPMAYECAVRAPKSRMVDEEDEEEDDLHEWLS